MAKCANCGSTIVFGGKRAGDARVCSQDCLNAGLARGVVAQVPDDVVRKAAQEIFQGQCPQCNGPGPVDVHTVHTIWSALIMTRWGSNARLSCRRCGVRAQAGGLVSSLVLGWWGVPWGLIMTPVQAFRNIKNMMITPTYMQPSHQLENHVRFIIASSALEQKVEQTQAMK